MGRRLLLTCLTSLGVACADPAVLELKLVTPGGLDPAHDFTTYVVRVVQHGTGEVVASADLGPDSVNASRNALSAERLREGAEYQVLLEAQAPVCGQGRAVGRSLPFEHRDGSYTITLQVGCAGEFSHVGAPRFPRIGHALLASGDGGAIVVGGGRELRREELAYLPAEMVGEVERYDPTRGSFVTGSSIRDLRAYGTGIELASGEVAFLGGVTSLLQLSDAVEIVRPTSLTTARRGRLTVARSRPAVARLGEGGRIAVIGGLVAAQDEAAPPSAELYAADLSTLDPVPIEGPHPRGAAQAIALPGGRGHLVIGTPLAPSEPVAALLRPDCGSGQACFDPITMVPEFRSSWSEGSATYVPCREGDGGAVYVVGGKIADVPTNLVACYRDDPSAPGSSFVAAGTLPAAISRHTAFATRTPAGGTGLVLVGGEEQPTGALLVQVDACHCGAPDVVGPVTVPQGMVLFSPEGAQLADGTFLIVNSIDLLTTTADRVVAQAGAMLYFPGSP